MVKLMQNRSERAKINSSGLSKLANYAVTPNKLNQMEKMANSKFSSSFIFSIIT
jgi:hypothetical protein